MSTSPPTRKGPRRVPVKDRRGAPGAKGTTGSLRRLKGLLGRPLGLERRGGRLRVVLIDRRRASPADQPPSLSQLRAELRARLLALHHPPEDFLDQTKCDLREGQHTLIVPQGFGLESTGLRRLAGRHFFCGAQPSPAVRSSG